MNYGLIIFLVLTAAVPMAAEAAFLDPSDTAEHTDRASEGYRASTWHTVDWVEPLKPRADSWKSYRYMEGTPDSRMYYPLASVTLTSVNNPVDIICFLPATPGLVTRDGTDVFDDGYSIKVNVTDSDTKETTEWTTKGRGICSSGTSVVVDTSVRLDDPALGKYVITFPYVMMRN